jgi:hypothetical protein
MAKRRRLNSILGAWELPEDAAMRLPPGRAIVRVERGTVMVTREGDLDDHVLERGDELLLGAPGRTIAWAFTDAEISLRDATAVAPPPDPAALEEARP